MPSFFYNDNQLYLDFFTAPPTQTELIIRWPDGQEQLFN
jgi:hypothetical protein